MGGGWKMKTGKELLAEHGARIERAVRMEKNDRIPIVLNADAFCLRYGGGKMADVCRDVRAGNQTIIKGTLKLGDVDGVYMYGVYPPMMGSFFMSKIECPGRELPEDTLWQIHEIGLMTEEDYDTIIAKGWGPFFADFCKNRLDNALDKEMANFLPHAPAIAQDFMEAGLFSVCAAMALPPFETLCPGRGIPKFMRDLRRDPNKVQAVIDVMMTETVEGLRQQIRATKPFGAFIGASRAAGNFLSPANFERFEWPYLKKLIEVTIEEGAYAYLHLDLSWDNLLDYFLELPKGKCIFSPDSATDIFKAAKKLKGHMAFTGDVPASLLALGTPQQVTDYCQRLKDEVGPDGLIMSSGCSVPFNAKPENVEAMVASAFN